MNLQQEENDLTQEMRQMVVRQVQWELDRMIKRIEDAKPAVVDEWSDGMATGLDWAIRIIEKDKSAY